MVIVAYDSKLEATKAMVLWVLALLAFLGLITCVYFIVQAGMEQEHLQKLACIEGGGVYDSTCVWSREAMKF